MGDDWFPSISIGPKPRSTPFLERVRALAPGRLGGSIRPEDTEHFDYSGCLVVVDVLAESSPTQVLLQSNWNSGVLAGCWSDGHLWDQPYERDEEALLVRGVDLTDDAAAGLAVDWLARQLVRPVCHEIWRSTTRIVSERWTLADSGRVIGVRGSPLARRRQPDVTRTAGRPAM